MGACPGWVNAWVWIVRSQQVLSCLIALVADIICVSGNPGGWMVCDCYYCVKVESVAVPAKKDSFRLVTDQTYNRLKPTKFRM